MARSEPRSGTRVPEARSACTTKVSNICDTFALYMLLWAVATRARTAVVASASADFLIAACMRVQEVPGLTECPLTTVHTWSGEARPLHLRRGRLVIGLHRAMLGCLRPQSYQCFARVWSSMCVDGALEDNFERDEHALRDVVRFTLSFLSVQRARKRPIGSSAAKFLEVLQCGLVHRLAEHMDLYILDVYLEQHRPNKPAPALVSPQKHGRRAYVQVQAESVWSLIQKSRQAGCSLATIVRSRADDADAGCSESRAQVWMQKHQDMYARRRRWCFHGARHLNIVADPSTHSKKETLVSVCWTFEFGVAAHADVQFLPATSVMLPSEHELPRHLGRMAAEHRLKRVSAFRQLQALSNTIRTLGNELWSSLAAFRLPENFHIRAVESNQVRIIRGGADFDRAVLFDKSTRRCLSVLPDTLASTQGVPLLVLGLDQGSVGCAGAAFLDHVGAMVHCKWDKIHRCIRDIKLSLSHSCGGLFLKTQLYTSHLWGLNYKPFGTGLLGTQKKEALNTFLAAHDAGSLAFRKYGERIAKDAGMSFDSDHDREHVFENLSRIAGSFSQCKELSKLGRWFSWNACAKEQLPEFWACKMLYENHTKSTCDPDDNPVAFDDLEAAARAKTPYAELAKLKAANGGLRLAYKLMTEKLWQHAKLLYVATRPCWTWYTREVQTVKSPGDNLRESFAMSNSRWKSDAHLSELVRDSLVDATSLAYAGVEMGASGSVLASRLFDLTVHILSHRAWSLAVRHHGPPACYADLLSPDTLAATQGATLMRANWETLLLLEHRRLSYEPARLLWSDIHYARSSPLRLLYVYFERERFRRDCHRGLHLTAPQTVDCAKNLGDSGRGPQGWGGECSQARAEPHSGASAAVSGHTAPLPQRGGRWPSVVRQNFGLLGSNSIPPKKGYRNCAHGAIWGCADVVPV